MSRDPKRNRLARSLRQQNVPAEALLWKALRNRLLGGFKFRRQHPIGSHVVDFACPECMLIVEVDGTSHLTERSADKMRSRSIEEAGWRVIRFWNTDVYDDLEPVKEAIYAECVRRAER